MAKGDTITVVTKTGSEIIVRAAQNGRVVRKSIEKESGISWLVIQEVTRGGTVINETQVSLADVMTVTKIARE